MNAIIIDDDKVSAELIAGYIAKTGFIHLAGIFQEPEQGLSFISTASPDLVFLDIEMPGMSGMELLRALEKSAPMVILVTSHEKFAIEAFEHRVIDYLVKPVGYPRFFKAVNAARSQYRQSRDFTEEDVLFVRKDNLMVRLRKSDIHWIEALGDYAVLNTSSEKYVMHCTLKIIEEKLSPRSYMRVHRSYIVKIDRIDKVEDNTIFCSNKAIPIGKSYREEVYRRLRLF